jgi:hypothetical protein
MDAQDVNARGADALVIGVGRLALSPSERMPFNEMLRVENVYLRAHHGEEVSDFVTW